MSLAQGKFPNSTPTSNEICICKNIFLAVFLQSADTYTDDSAMPPPIPLTSGQKAPAFSYTEARAHDSQHMKSLAPHLIYFYPKDDTPGCTKEACAIRDAWADFGAAGLKVIGVSKDTERSHRKFQDKYALPFPLIADTELAIGKCLWRIRREAVHGPDL